MARPQTYEPIIVEALKASDKGMTRRELAELAGCSLQQVHKIVEKADLDPSDPRHLPIKVIGRGRNGAQILGWDHTITTPVGKAHRVELGKGQDRAGAVRVAGQVAGQAAGFEGDGTIDVPTLGARLQVVGMEMVDGAVKVTVRDEHGQRHAFTGTFETDDDQRIPA